MVKQQLTKVAETPVSFRLCHSWIMYQPCKWYFSMSKRGVWGVRG
jgi:hypothetical protein